MSSTSTPSAASASRIVSELAKSRALARLGALVEKLLRALRQLVGHIDHAQNLVEVTERIRPASRICRGKRARVDAAVEFADQVEDRARVRRKH